MTNSERLRPVRVKLTVAYLVEQPIMHTEETIGNISKLKKMRVIYNGQPQSVPALSGNSFRGQLRDILADQLCASLSEQGTQKLRFSNNDVYGILYSGGALGERRKSAQLIHSFSENVPSMRLMGAAFGNVLLPSKLATTHIIPCAKETSQVLEGMCTSLGTGLIPPASEWPNASSLVFNDGPLTRKDDRRDIARQRFAEPQSVEPAAEEESERSQMIYYVECIPSGTWLLQQIYSKLPLDQLELGCLFDGLSAFLEAPTLGGRSAAGYGQVQVKIRGSVGGETVSWPPEWPETVQIAVRAYRDYLEHNREALLSVLTVTPENS